MAFFEKNMNDIKVLFLMVIGIPLIASTNIDCRGKSFHCLNSTHFMICVDLGGGVSYTVDDFVIPCPPPTVCKSSNNFECEMPLKTNDMQTIAPPVTSPPQQQEKETTREDVIVDTFAYNTEPELHLELSTVATTQETSTDASVIPLQPDTNRNVIETNPNATESTLVTTGLLELTTEFILDILNDTVPINLYNSTSGDSAFAATFNISKTNSTDMKNETKVIDQVYTTESVISDKHTEITVNDTVLSEITVGSNNVTENQKEFLVTLPENGSVLDVLVQETTLSSLSERSVPTTETGTHRNVIETNLTATKSSLVTNGSLEFTTVSNLVTKNDSVPITFDNATSGDSVLAANSNISNNNSTDMKNETNVIDQVYTTESVISDKHTEVAVNDTVLLEITVGSNNVTEHRKEFLVTSPEDGSVLDVLVQETTLSSLSERSVPTTETGTHRNVIETNLNATKSSLVTNGSLEFTTVSNLVIKNDSVPIAFDNATSGDSAFAANSNISNTKSTDMKNETNVIDQVYTTESVINDKPTEVTGNVTVLPEITVVSKNVTEHREEFLVTSPEDGRVLDVLVQETTVSSLSELSLPATETGIDRNVIATESNLVTNGSLELTTVSNLIIKNDPVLITLNNATLEDSAFATTSKISNINSTDTKSEKNLIDQVYTTESVLNDKPTEEKMNETVLSEVSDVATHREEFLVTSPEDRSVLDVLQQETTVSSLNERSVQTTKAVTHRNVTETNSNATESNFVTNSPLESTTESNVATESDIVPIITLDNSISGDSVLVATSNISNTNSTDMKNETNLIGQVYTTESVLNDKPTEEKMNKTVLSEVSDVTTHREEFLVTSPEERSVLDVLQQETTVFSLNERSVPTTKAVTHRNVAETNSNATESNFVTNSPLESTTESNVATESDIVPIITLDNSISGDSVLVATSNISNTNSTDMKNETNLIGQVYTTESVLDDKPTEEKMNKTVLSEVSDVTTHREEFLVTSPEERSVLDVLQQETTVFSLNERSVPTTKAVTHRNVAETNLNATESNFVTNGPLESTTASTVATESDTVPIITLNNSISGDSTLVATSNISNTNSTDMKNETNLIGQVYTTESVINDNLAEVNVHETVPSKITVVSNNITEHRDQFLVTSPEVLDVLVQETTVPSLSERSVPTTETGTYRNVIEENLNATETILVTNSSLELTTVSNQVIKNDSVPITLKNATLGDAAFAATSNISNFNSTDMKSEENLIDQVYTTESVINDKPTEKKMNETVLSEVSDVTSHREEFLVTSPEDISILDVSQQDTKVSPFNERSVSTTEAVTHRNAAETNLNAIESNLVKTGLSESTTASKVATESDTVRITRLDNSILGDSALVATSNISNTNSTDMKNKTNLIEQVYATESVINNNLAEVTVNETVTSKITVVSENVTEYRDEFLETSPEVRSVLDVLVQEITVPSLSERSVPTTETGTDRNVIKTNLNSRESNLVTNGSLEPTTVFNLVIKNDSVPINLNNATLGNFAFAATSNISSINSTYMKNETNLIDQVYTTESVINDKPAGKKINKTVLPEVSDVTSHREEFLVTSPEDRSVLDVLQQETTVSLPNERSVPTTESVAHINAIETNFNTTESNLVINGFLELNTAFKLATKNDTVPITTLGNLTLGDSALFVTPNISNTNATNMKNETNLFDQVNTTESVINDNPTEMTVNETVLSEINVASTNVTEHREEFLNTSLVDTSALNVLVQETTESSLSERSVSITETGAHRNVTETNLIVKERTLVTNGLLELTTVSNPEIKIDTVPITLDYATLGHSAFAATFNISNTNSTDVKNGTNIFDQAYAKESVINKKPTEVKVNKIVFSEVSDVMAHREEFSATSPEDSVLDVSQQETTVSPISERSVLTTEAVTHRNVIEINFNVTQSNLVTTASKLNTVPITISDNLTLGDLALIATPNITNTNGINIKNETNVFDQINTTESVINEKPTELTVNETVLSEMIDVSKNVIEDREAFLVTSPVDRSVLDVLMQETAVSSLSERLVPTTETGTHRNVIETSLKNATEISLVTNGSLELTTVSNLVIKNNSRPIVLGENEKNAKDSAKIPHNVMNTQAIEYTPQVLSKDPSHTAITLQIGGDDISSSLINTEKGKDSTLQNNGNTKELATSENNVTNVQQTGVELIVPPAQNNESGGETENALQFGGVEINTSFSDSQKGKNSILLVENVEIATRPATSKNNTIEQNGFAPVLSTDLSDTENTIQFGEVALNSSSSKTKQGKDNTKSVKIKNITLKPNRTINDVITTQQSQVEHITSVLKPSAAVNTLRVDGVKQSNLSLITEPSEANVLQNNNNDKVATTIQQNRTVLNTPDLSKELGDRVNTTQIGSVQDETFIQSSLVSRTDQSKDTNIIFRNGKNEETISQSIMIKNNADTLQNNIINEQIPFPLENGKIKAIKSASINDSTNMLQNYTGEQIVLVTNNVPSSTTDNEIKKAQAPHEFSESGSSIATNSKKDLNSENINTESLLNFVQNEDSTIIKTGKEIDKDIKLQQMELQSNIINITQGKQNVTESVNIERNIEAAQTETPINLSDSNQPAHNNMNVIDNGGRNEQVGSQNIEVGTLKIMNSNDHISSKVIEVIKTTISGRSKSSTVSSVPEDLEVKKDTTTVPSSTMAANDNTAFSSTQSPDTLHSNSAKTTATYSTTRNSQVHILNSDSVPVTKSTFNDNKINDYIITPTTSTIALILPGDGQQITQFDDTFRLDHVDKIDQDGNTRVSTTENIDTITSVTGESVNIAITTTSYGDIMKNTYTLSAVEISTKSTTTKASEEPISKFKPKTNVNNALPSLTVKRTNISATNGKPRISIEKGFDCQNRATGKYADNKDCSKFYICSGRTQAIVGACPLNTVFSEIRKQCTRNLSHCIRNNEFKCTSVGRFADYLKPTVYYICMRKEHSFLRYKLQCQKGYLLNRLTVTCYRHIQSTSKSTSSDISQSTTEKLSKENDAIKKSSTKNAEEEFECEDEGKFGDPNNCRGYYICKIKNKSDETYYQKYKKCDDDEVFHKEKKKCVDVGSYECRYCDSQTPNTYYVQVTSKQHSLTYKLQCQNGYYLNKTRIRCVKKPASEITTREAENFNKNGKIAECKAEGKLADPNDRRRYYICKEKYKSGNSETRFRRKHKKCKSRKVFNAERQKCIYSRNTRCL